MTTRLLLAIAMLLPIAHVYAQVSPMQARNEAACHAALAKPFTPPPLDASLTPECDSSASYFGINRPKDYAAALRCAYVERAHPRPSVGDLFYGPGVLSMIYANGYGTAPNIALAKRFTCENEWAAPAELDGRLEILAQDTSTGTLHPFDLCDTATSGLSEGNCADIETRLHQADRQNKIKLLASKLPPAALPAFHTLQAAEDAFDELRSSKEVDLSGTGRAAFELEEQDTLREQFLINLQRLTAPSFTSPVPLQAADKNLNLAYQALKTSMPSKEMSDSTSYGTIGFEGVQQTQRAWLTLRAAWVAFAAALHSPATPDQVAAVITEQRAHQLQSLYSH